MAKIVDYREIPLDDLVIGLGQVRTDNPGAGVEGLAASIEAQGLLQPIVVCEATQPGKWEILTGQRRFLAYRMLNRETISAAVLDSHVGEAEAKTISITENLMRRKLSGKELKDGIFYLYNIYGSVKDVVETTGLPYREVRDYVKYPRLVQQLKDLVDEGKVDVNAALRAQDSATDDDGEVNTKDALVLAQEMASMSGAQRKKVEQDRRNNPDKTVVDVIEGAKSGSKVIQIVATVTLDVHQAIQKVAREEGTNQGEATGILIEEALSGRGLLDT